MGILLAFLPFIVFAVLDRLVGPLAGLACATVVSVLQVGRDLFLLHRMPKLLELGSTLLFGGLTFYTALAAVELPIMEVRLLVDAGLLLIILTSLLIGKPFTQQYARERVPREQWTSPTFQHTNIVITRVWALALALVVITDTVLLYAPDSWLRMGTVVIVGALLAAFKFTGWYPSQARSVAGEHQTPQP